MLRWIRIENYKALREVSIDLTPIHALIGPNDSGKTSVLEAVAALCRSVDQPLPDCFTGSWSGRSLVWHGATEPTVTLSAGGDAGTEQWTYRLQCRFGPERQVVTGDESAEINGSAFHTDVRGGHLTVVQECSASPGHGPRRVWQDRTGASRPALRSAVLPLGPTVVVTSGCPRLAAPVPDGSVRLRPGALPRRPSRL